MLCGCAAELTGPSGLVCAGTGATMTDNSRSLDPPRAGAAMATPKKVGPVSSIPWTMSARLRRCKMNREAVGTDQEANG
jgi:hypothetical protein